MSKQKLQSRQSAVNQRAGNVKAPLGNSGLPLTLDELPPPNTSRWVMRRKAEVVAGVRTGLISLNEACKRYTLSVDEFLSWQSLFDRYGMNGLRSTRIKDYR